MALRVTSTAFPGGGTIPRRVLYKIPAECTAVAEGDNAGAVEGTTSWGSPGYGGPMPPPGHGVD